MFSPMATGVTPDRVGLVLLASGMSSRFGGDKLMADLGGAPLLMRTAGMLGDLKVARGFAVVGQDQLARQTVLSPLGWNIVHNPKPEDGQGASIALGVAAVRKAGLSAALIMLADMPFVPRNHLSGLVAGLGPGAPAVMSLIGDRLMPPAIFGASIFPKLEMLKGDQGARQIVSSLSGLEHLALDLQSAVDIDTPADLLAVIKRL